MGTSNKKRTKKANDDGHIFSLYSCVIIVVSVATLRPSKYCYESLTRSERAASSSTSPSASVSSRSHSFLRHGVHANIRDRMGLFGAIRHFKNGFDLTSEIGSTLDKQSVAIVAI